MLRRRLDDGLDNGQFGCRFSGTAERGVATAAVDLRIGRGRILGRVRWGCLRLRSTAVRLFRVSRGLV